MSQRTFKVVEDRARYSNFIEELETTSYFLDDQEIRLLLKNTQYSPMDLRSSGSYAQSVSEKVVKETELELKNCMPKCVVHYRYLRTFLQAW